MRYALVSFVVATGLAGVCPELQAAPVLMVIPPRHTVVQLAFDIARLRPTYLVAYDTRAPGGMLVLHFWDPYKRDWVKTNLEEYMAGALFDELPERVFVIGSDIDVPREVLEGTRWGAEIQRVRSLRVVDVVNALDTALCFKRTEWKWLAGRYGLKIMDLNAERRRYGRYGKPGTVRPPQRLPTVPPPETIPSVPLPHEPSGMPAPEPVEPLPQDN